ncbi:MAG TPA: hypothetical protein VI248_18690 [Kineosporiaceae bacterium]
MLVGTGIWAVLWLAALLLHGPLHEAGRDWWIWTPPAGIALGALGLRYLERREQQVRRAGRAGPGPRQGPGA